VDDDLVRLAALDVGDESDAAGILGERGIVKAVRIGRARIGGIEIERARVDEFDGLATFALTCPLLAHPRRRSHASVSGRRHTIHVPSTVRRCGPKATRVEGSPFAGCWP